MHAVAKCAAQQQACLFGLGLVVAGRETWLEAGLVTGGKCSEVYRVFYAGFSVVAVDYGSMLEVGRPAGGTLVDRWVWASDLVLVQRGAEGHGGAVSLLLCGDSVNHVGWCSLVL
jgi:hypothetical protein